MKRFQLSILRSLIIISARKIQITVLSIILFPTLFFSQEMRFNHYNSENGFDANLPYDFNMVHDKRGFLWIPTINGLNRFDGREFKVFRYERGNPKGLNINFIHTVFEDKSGKIWIGTKGGGINIYDPETGTFEYIMHDPDDPESLCGNDVRTIYQDREGNFWIGTMGNVVCRCEEGSRKFKTYPSVGTLGYLEQENGTVWKGGGMDYTVIFRRKILLSVLFLTLI